MKKALFFLFLVIPFVSFSQTQIGSDIDGEAAFDSSGRSVSINADGSIVAIGANLNDGNGSGSGHVRVYQNIAGTWTQIGSDIDGEAAGDQFGTSVSINADGSIVAIGAIANDGNGSDSGHVRVYQNIAGAWTQIGADIDGEATSDFSGRSVSINDDGSIVAIGAFGNDANGSNSGHVRIYQNIAGTWTQIGSDIDGEAADDQSGTSVSINEDGSIVAIGASNNDENGSNSGHVRVYQNIAGTWAQIGSDIDGETTSGFSGRSVSINDDGSIVAIGAFGNDANGSNSGHVRVYQNIAGAWTQIGADIDGEATGDFSGTSVSINDDGSIVAIGATGNNGNGSDSGHVRIYQNIAGTWTQIGSDIDGEAFTDSSGSSVSMNADGTIVAIGAPNNESQTGHVRVYNTSDNAWIGATDTNWVTGSNWTEGSSPGVSDNIAVLAGLTNYPTASSAVTIGSVTMASGTSLIAQSTFSGTVTYNRNLATTNWYLLGSPVSGETIEDLITNNTFAAGTGSNIGLAPYLNDGTAWSFQTAASTGAFTSGGGYSVKLAAAGDISFSGTMPVADLGVSISSNTNSFNLVGNPYPSFLAANTGAHATNNLLTVNTASLTENTLWFWDQATNSYDIINLASAAFYAAPGQGFFVSSTGSNTFNFTEAMQSHQTDSFQRTSSTRPEILLSLTDGSLTKNADIFYIDGTTTGWDNGYDSTIFAGVANDFAIYTHLVSGSTGQDLGIQSLPDTGFETMVVPVGINATSGTNISISALATHLPAGLNVYLEDKEDDSFTLLDGSTEFSTALTSDLNGIGRFYIHTTSSALSTDEINLDHLSVYTSDSNNLRIVGIQNGRARVNMYNILGKQVLATSFQGNGVNDVPLPELRAGIYIVQLETGNGKLNTKLIIE